MILHIGTLIDLCMSSLSLTIFQTGGICSGLESEADAVEIAARIGSRQSRRNKMSLAGIRNSGVQYSQMFTGGLSLFSWQNKLHKLFIVL